MAAGWFNALNNDHVARDNQKVQDTPRTGKAFSAREVKEPLTPLVFSIHNSDYAENCMRGLRYETEAE